MKVKEIIRESIWYLFITIIVLYGAISGYWLLYPYNPITVQSPIEIINPGRQVKVGDFVVYKIKYNKYMDVHGTLSRKLVNSYKIDLADSFVTAPVGKDCDQVKIKIPNYADPGVYYLWWSVSYKVNPLRTITVSAESEKFEVVK
jgi:hypothetical protein